MIRQQLLHPTQLSGLNGFRSKPTKTMNKAYQAQRQKQQAAAAGPYTLSMSFCMIQIIVISLVMILIGKMKNDSTYFRH